MNITKITFCKLCNKLLYIRNLCSICAVNFHDLNLKEKKLQIEKMNNQRAEGFDFLNKCELCGTDSKLQYEGIEKQVCIDCLSKQ